MICSGGFEFVVFTTGTGMPPRRKRPKSLETRTALATSDATSDVTASEPAQKSSKTCGDPTTTGSGSGSALFAAVTNSIGSNGIPILQLIQLIVSYADRFVMVKSIVKPARTDFVPVCQTDDEWLLTHNQETNQLSTLSLITGTGICI